MGNLLDLVFTNNQSLVKASTSVPGISDHSMVVTDIDILPCYARQKPRKIYMYSKADWTNIYKDAETLSNNIKNMEATQSTTVEELWSTFKQGISETMISNIPSKTCKARQSVPWFSKSLRKMVKKKARLYNQAKKSNQWNTFHAFQKACKREFKKAEIDHINSTIQQGLDEHNTKPFWRYVKSKRQDSFGISPLKKMGQLTNISKEKAQILVDQFRSVFTRESTTTPTPTMKKKANKSIPPLIIAEKGVEKLLKNINQSKAQGPDNISNTILKNCATQLAPGLSRLFQLSINTGKLPSDWLKANIAPVYKKGDVHLPENYRPVSLTCVTCKLLEHILCHHILAHLESNKTLTSLQHGFRSGYSCETQLLTTIHDLLERQNAGDQVDLLILDFSKAFDTVPHEKLLYKMENYGVDGNINTWLRQFLTMRHMQVVVEGEHSDPVTVDSGVPQGTVLGPLLFLCHINDLPEAVKSQVRLFADDCLLYRSIKSRQDHHILQNDLTALEAWGAAWGMKFNAQKCYMISIKSKSTNFYTLNSQILKQVQDNPYLGLTISEDLKWDTHITKISKKGNSTIGFLKRNLKHCPQDCRRSAYLALVRSVLEYGSVVWDPYYVKDINRLEKVQRQAARFISGDYKSRDSGCVTQMLSDLDLPSLQDRRRTIRLTFFYKVVEGLVPAMHCQDFLTPIRPKRRIIAKEFKDCVATNIVERHSTNNSKCYKLPVCNSEQFKNSFFPKTVIEWNHLDEETVRSTSLESFKTALCKFS
jgi:hypothetical protein